MDSKCEVEVCDGVGAGDGGEVGVGCDELVVEAESSVQPLMETRRRSIQLLLNCAGKFGRVEDKQEREMMESRVETLVATLDGLTTKSNQPSRLPLSISSTAPHVVLTHVAFPFNSLSFGRTRVPSLWPCSSCGGLVFAKKDEWPRPL
ncbi:hypothetical protein Droror1_Dr00017222 [Drosera rotundifolia]